METHLLYFNIQDPLPLLCSRTPKHLAPLDQEYRDGHVFSNFQCPLAPKMTSQTFSSKETRKRFSRLSFRRSRGIGRGSEDSSYSSQSSLDEEEEEENSHTETMQRDPQIAIVPPLSAQQLRKSGITEYIYSNETSAIKSKLMRHQKHEAENTQNSVTEFSKRVKPFETTYTVDTDEKSEALDVCRNKTTYAADNKIIERAELIGSPSNEPEDPEDTVTDARHALADGQSGSFVDSEQHHVSYANIALHPSPAETTKDSKVIRSEGIKGRSSLTNQTTNILEQINTRRDHGEPKRRNRRSQTQQVVIKEMGDVNVISQETNNKLDWPKMAPVKHGSKFKDAPLARRRTPESLHQGRLSGTKKISNKAQSQKQVLNWDTKKTTSKGKKLGSLGTPRTKSSLDYVSYRDMFQEICRADEGPAIFEMFATPIYENLRAGSSADRPKQVLSAPQFKRQLSGRHRVQNPVEGNKRKQKCTTSKGKIRKRKEPQPPEPQTHDQATDSYQDDARLTPGAESLHKVQTRQHQRLTAEEDGRLGSDTRLQTECSRVLSMIREVPSDTDTRIAFHKRQGELSSSFQSHKPSDADLQFLPLKSDHNIKGDGISNLNEDSVLSSQHLIDTWTTDRTKSPVYQRFLEEVGEGPVTDDLLKRLAEELISLEEREVETLKSENPGMTNDALSKFKKIFYEVYH